MKGPFLYCLISILLFVSCDRDKTQKIDPPNGEQKKPHGILEFAVQGVPAKNILFTALNSGGEPSWIQVTLPQDYPHGTKIRISMKMPAGYAIAADDKFEYDLSGFELDYEGSSIRLHVVDTIKKEVKGQIYILVDPEMPLVAPSVGKNYEFTLSDKGVYPEIPVENWGTHYTVDDSGLHLKVAGTAMLREIKSGKTISTTAGFDLGTKLTVAVPDTIEAGQYELTLERNKRRVIVPDLIQLKYGEPKIKEFHTIRTSPAWNNLVTYSGYNLLANHSYEIELQSDFNPTSTYSLRPAGHLKIETNLPKSLPAGSYKARLMINKTPVPYTNYLTSINQVVVLETPNHSGIELLSQKSYRYDNPSGLILFKPTSSFKRNEEIIAFITSNPPVTGSDNTELKLILKNTNTGTEYELSKSDSLAVRMFPQFSIPSMVPNGRYEVRSVTRFLGSSGQYISGPYYQSILIE